MANPNDITRDIEADDNDIADMKKAHYDANVGQTRIKAPVPEVSNGLNQELLNMLTLGKKSAQFQGLERCIRVVEKDTPNQRHCMSMMVNNLSTNQKMCSSCDRIRDPNARPQTINSASIRLSQRELEECGLASDPLLNAKVVAPAPKKRVSKPEGVAVPQRRPKVAAPNSVKIEVTMKELENDPNIVNVLLMKALEAIYELPITKFSEAEAIRGTSEKIKALLSLQGSGD